MPRYDYRCEAGHQYELQQPFGSPSEHECHKCGRPARRIVTVAPPLVFKAGGYYKTAGRDLAADRSDSSSSESSTGGSSDARYAEAKPRSGKEEAKSSGTGSAKPSAKARAGKKASTGSAD